MHYFGIPTCPYCKKRVNVIRVWSMKKHGEFMCPRCKGISNIRLSPLVYVFAVLAIAAGFLIYFFAKFVLDNVSIMTPVHVLIPFVVFFLISLFFVYLEKPVIKKVRKTADGRYFDENGNEMKMKMGKMVSASGEVPVQQRSQTRYQDNYESQKFDIKNTPAEARPQRRPQVTRADMEYTNSEIAPVIKEEKVQPRQEIRTETAARPVPERNTRSATGSKPQARKQDSALPAAEDIPVGDIARHRVEGAQPDSGFEDLFKSYPAAKPQKTEVQRTERPVQRAPAQRQQPAPNRQDDKKKSGGTRFRDL